MNKVIRLKKGLETISIPPPHQSGGVGRKTVGGEQSPLQELFDAVIDFESGKPRLREARRYFSELSQEDIPFLVEVFKYWRDYPEYLIIKGENQVTGEKKGLAVLCSKRGNEVYGKRFDKRLDFLKYGDYEFFKPGDLTVNKKVHSRLLWVTLTFDSKLCSLDESWRGRESRVFRPGKKGGIQVYQGGVLGRLESRHEKSCLCLMCSFNSFITNLRNKYGKISYVAFPQAFPGQNGEAFGYSHMHLVMLFEEASFEVFPSLEECEDGSFALKYRIKEKYEIEKQGKYHSFIDIQAFRSSRGVYNYARKYAQNVSYGDSYEANLNNALLWLFKKKGFNVSETFRKHYSDLIQDLRNSKGFFQRNLFGEVFFETFSHWVWSFVGINSFSELQKAKEDFVPGGYPPWFVGLSVNEISSLNSS